MLQHVISAENELITYSARYYLKPIYAGKYKRNTQKNERECNSFCNSDKPACTGCSKWVGCGPGKESYRKFDRKWSKAVYACRYRDWANKSQQNYEKCLAYCADNEDCSHCDKNPLCGLTYHPISGASWGNGLFDGQAWYACFSLKEATAQNKADCEDFCEKHARCHTCMDKLGCGLNDLDPYRHSDDPDGKTYVWGGGLFDGEAWVACKKWRDNNSNNPNHPTVDEFWQHRQPITGKEEYVIMAWGGGHGGSENDKVSWMCEDNFWNTDGSARYENIYCFSARTKILSPEDSMSDDLYWLMRDIQDKRSDKKMPKLILIGKSMGGCVLQRIFNGDKGTKNNGIYENRIRAELFIGLDTTCTPNDESYNTPSRWLQKPFLWKDYIIFRQQIDSWDPLNGVMNTVGTRFYTGSFNVDEDREVRVNRDSWSVERMQKIDGISLGSNIYHKQMESNDNLMRTVINIVYKFVGLPYEDNADIFEVKSKPGASDPAYANNELVNAEIEVFIRHFNDIKASQIKLRYFFYNQNFGEAHADIWYLDIDGIVVPTPTDIARIGVRDLHETIDVDGKKANKFVEISFKFGSPVLKANSGATPAISLEFAAWFGNYGSFVGNDADDWSYQDVETFTTTDKIEIVTNDMGETNLYGQVMDVETDLSSLISWPSWPVYPYVFLNDPATWPVVASPITGGIYRCKSGAVAGFCESRVPGETYGWEEAWELDDMYTDPVTPDCADIDPWQAGSYHSGDLIRAPDLDNPDNTVIYQCLSWPVEGWCGQREPYTNGWTASWMRVGHCASPMVGSVAQDWEAGTTYKNGDIVQFGGSEWVCDKSYCGLIYGHFCGMAGWGEPSNGNGGAFCWSQL